MGKAAVGDKGSAVAGAEEAALQAAKTYLKRLAKENVKTVGRQLGKHTHSFPLIVFTHILGQIEAYDNLIPFVVDALKHATQLSKDVLAFALLGQLSKDADKLKRGDTHYSGWFASLTKFIAALYRRYPMTELRGLLHLLVARLAAGSSLDLLVLKELLGRMGGCETMLEVSHAQLDGLAGGRLLRSEVMASSVLESVNKRAALRLREELLASGTALPLLVLTAQTRQHILHGAEAGELKLVSYLHDTCQDVLLQFADFLVVDGSLEAVARIVPPMDRLTGELGLPLPVAFALVRPLMRAALSAGSSPADAPPHLGKTNITPCVPPTNLLLSSAVAPAGG